MDQERSTDWFDALNQCQHQWKFFFLFWFQNCINIAYKCNCAFFSLKFIKFGPLTNHSLITSGRKKWFIYLSSQKRQVNRPLKSLDVHGQFPILAIVVQYTSIDGLLQMNFDRCINKPNNYTLSETQGH